MSSPVFPGGAYAYPVQIDAGAIATAAANIKNTDNPPYTGKDFTDFFPQFRGIVEDNILNQFVTMADSVVAEPRWHEMWKLGMSLYVAHMVTLWLSVMANSCDPSAAEVAAAAQARGIPISKSVGDVSVSYDFATIGNDLGGWAMMKSTKFGLQFASLAKQFGKAGVYVW